MDLKEQAALGERLDGHWYYVSKARALRAMLGPAKVDLVLDVGAGSGFFSRYLLASGLAGSAVCVDTGYREERYETVAGKPVSFVRSCASIDADLVLLMDVLEHVDDDSGLMAEYREKVPAGCRFAITVPAFSWLWSGHDDFLEHRRRYTAQQLVQAVRMAELRPLENYYFYAAVLPIAMVVRLWPRLFSGGRAVVGTGLKRHSRIVNAVLKGMCALELPFFNHNHVAGLSVFMLAEKR